MNTKTLDRLRQDHHNLEQLLGILEHQLHVVQWGEAADFELAEQVVEYLTDYPDQYHHPFEDLLLQRLQARQPGIREQAQRGEAQHRTLRARGHALKEAIQDVLVGQLVGRSPLQAQGEEYCRAYREHLAFEETVLFPLLEAHLTEGDWIEQLTRFHWSHDPVFSEPVGVHYQELRARLHAAKKPAASAEPGFCPLCDVT